MNSNAKKEQLKHEEPIALERDMGVAPPPSQCNRLDRLIALVTNDIL